jgi:hypothetical protein
MMTKIVKSSSLFTFFFMVFLLVSTGAIPGGSILAGTQAL